MNSYELSRTWFDWCFENPDKIKPVHSAMYFFIIEHCNRLGWKEKFGLPMEMTKDAIGISNYRTYSNTLNDLIEWGFVELIQKSKNQYSSTIIAIVQNTKATTEPTTKALDKALQKHSQKQGQSIVCIDKPNNNKQLTKEQRVNKFKTKVLEFRSLYSDDMLKAFYEYWSESGENDKKMRFEKQTSYDISRRLTTWKKKENNFNPTEKLKTHGSDFD
jgi:hypothetical protein